VGNKDILKRQPHIFIIIPIIIIIISALFYAVFFNDAINNNYEDNNVNEFGEITAFEGKTIADELALTWNSSAEFSYVGYNEDIKGWTYMYWNGVPGIGNEFLVNINKTGFVSFDNNTYLLAWGGIENWTIDSDLIYEIVMTNEDINDFMKLNPSIEYMHLAMSENGTPFWYINWISGNNSASVMINANTGSLFKVTIETDES